MAKNSAIKNALPAAQTSQPVTAFAPHIEAKRSFFNQLAENIVGLVTAEHEGEGFAELDLEPNSVFAPEPGTQHILINALEKHMRLIFEELLMLEPDSIRRFYAEMRMHIEQIRWETKQKYLEYQASIAPSCAEATGKGVK